jgi:hypothetical protein
MSARLRCFLLFTVIVMVASPAFSGPTIVNFDFGAVPIVCRGDYAYESPVTGCNGFIWPFQNFNAAPGFGWTLSGYWAVLCCPSALTGPGTSFLPPPFDGLPFSRAVALEGRGSAVSQVVGGFTAGGYTLTFYLGSRYASGQYDGNQTVEALIDGNVIGTWVLTSYTPFALQTVTFTVSTDGSHTLKFRGVNNGDHTAFLSYVIITPTE